MGHRNARNTCNTHCIEIGSAFELYVVIGDEFLLVCPANVVLRPLDGKHLSNEEGGEELFTIHVTHTVEMRPFCPH